MTGHERLTVKCGYRTATSGGHLRVDEGSRCTTTARLESQVLQLCRGVPATCFEAHLDTSGTWPALITAVCRLATVDTLCKLSVSTSIATCTSSSLPTAIRTPLVRADLVLGA